MKVLSICFFTFFVLQLSFGEESRRFACSLEFETDSYKSVRPGKSIAIDLSAIRTAIKNLKEEGKRAVQVVKVSDKIDYLEVYFEAIMGPECAVEFMPGCHGKNSGSPSHKYRITLKDTSTNLTASTSYFNRKSDVIAHRLPVLSMKVGGKVKDPEGNPIKNIFTECGSVFY